MVIGLISTRDPVKKFSIPFLVDVNLTLFTLEPVVLLIEPSVKNLYKGPLDLVIAVLIGERTSSACFIVGAVCTWCVVDVSTLRK